MRASFYILMHAHMLCVVSLRRKLPMRLQKADWWQGFAQSWMQGVSVLQSHLAAGDDR